MKPNKYKPLGAFLKKQFVSHIPVTFSEIEGVIGDKLPNSAYRHRPWWSNNPSNSVMTKVWLEAGFQTEQVDMNSKRLVFKRVQATSQGEGMPEAAQRFKAAEPETETEKKPRRSPLFGALKGTFTIEPGRDLTKPAMNPDELAEMFANIERTADMIEAGLSGKKK